MSVAEIQDLRKEYVRLKRGRRRRVVALDGLDLEVPEGGVFGFLGPNGSGKTTTIRCLLGLVQPSSGSCRLLGATSRAQLAAVLPRVGSIVETPALFPGFSARRNLELLGRVSGLGDQRIRASLERVGLAERADDRVKTYSTGMRQRLGIAAALLKDPEVLILDEPANGLDPGGIKEVRELIRGLGREGRTVFVSSHILSEVRQIADRVAILARGRCVASGAVDEVLAGDAPGSLVVKLAELDRGLAVLQAAGIACEPAGDAIRVRPAPDDPAEITRILARERLYVSELRREEADLETVFLELTREPAGEAR